MSVVARVCHKINFLLNQLKFQMLSLTAILRGCCMDSGILPTGSFWVQLLFLFILHFYFLCLLLTPPFGQDCHHPGLVPHPGAAVASSSDWRLSFLENFWDLWPHVSHALPGHPHSTLSLEPGGLGIGPAHCLCFWDTAMHSCISVVSSCRQLDPNT